MRVSIRSYLAVLPLALLATLAPDASAQYLEYRADELGVPVDPAARGIRLLAMGGMRFTIPDENNEITLSDFGQNIAGIASDKDGWSVESWFSRSRTVDESSRLVGDETLRDRLALTSEVMNNRVIYRNGSGRAVGSSFQWVAHSTSDRYGDRSKIRGPLLQAFWNESIGDLALGLSLQRWTDRQSLVSPDVFSIQHRSDVFGWTVAGSYPVAFLELGAQATIERVTIEGSSRDASGFHQDDLEWLRPTKKFRFSAFLPNGGDLELGVNLSTFTLDGAEEANISWSRQFPGNPGGFQFDRKVPTFEEEESGTRIEARALYWLGWAPRVSGFVAHESRSSDVTESPNFIGSRRQGSLDRSRNEIGGGLGTSLFDEELTLAVEGMGIFTTDDTVDLYGAKAQTKARDVSGRVGFEWFTRPDFILRGGYERLLLDSDVDGPFTLQTGQAASVGFGWVPKGATYVLDGLFRYVDRTPDETGGEERDGFELAVYGRLLF
ncbi:MAG: hypothetical protein KDA27_04360 [Candidatus Eisenbacteria bacterium]|uniref:Alginate export domain-containing protein n=1 Tax=Eiseniibacteriota bacterium TaxID=2212470 RepID=A0A956NBQ7_UNCEI|nr:hypothetical protein [Candidatus Eisenbacteria bacterium]MCB9462567.1 hypothetical protein [Candidatus Eisenbacteria bacterium]